MSWIFFDDFWVKNRSKNEKMIIFEPGPVLVFGRILGREGFRRVRTWKGGGFLPPQVTNLAGVWIWLLLKGLRPIRALIDGAIYRWRHL